MNVTVKTFGCVNRIWHFGQLYLRSSQWINYFGEIGLLLRSVVVKKLSIIYHVGGSLVSRVVLFLQFDWLYVSRNSITLFTSSQKQNGVAFWFNNWRRNTFWLNEAAVPKHNKKVYAKTIIHLSVGEYSARIFTSTLRVSRWMSLHYSPPRRWIIV